MENIQGQSLINPSPRFLDDQQLRERFGLSERALRLLKMAPGFPKRDGIVNKTDSRAVSIWFDTRAGLTSLNEVNQHLVPDGEENFET